MITSRTRMLVVSIVLISLLALAWKPIFGWHQPYINWAPWDLAEHLAEHGRSPRECLDLIYFEIMSPSEAEQQALCVYEYAKLTKDPSACELLMPSSYGLECVGAAEDFDPCIMLADGKKTVKGQGLETTYDSCQNGVNAQHVCCSMARVLYSDERNCGNFPQGELRDQCHHIVGVRLKKIEECSLIENERNRTGCEVVVRAYLTGRL